MQRAGIEVLEVTTPDKLDRRRRGKNDDLDAENAAHAAFAGKRTVTPRTRDGMVESLRVLRACRKTAVAARRVALQMIQNTSVCAPDALRDILRNMTRMQLIRTLAAWRPDLSAYRDVETAYRISLKSLARRYLELYDEIASAQPRRRQGRQQRAPHHRHLSATNRSENAGLRCQARHRGTFETRSNPGLEALHRTRGLHAHRAPPEGDQPDPHRRLTNRRASRAGNIRLWRSALDVVRPASDRPPEPRATRSTPPCARASSPRSNAS